MTNAGPIPRLSSLVVELDDAAKAAKRAEDYATDAHQKWVEAEADAEVARRRYRRAVFRYETWRVQAET